MVSGNGTRDAGFGCIRRENLAGVLLAEIKGECKKYHSAWRNLYVKFFDVMQHLVAGKGVDSYDAANKAMFKKYCESNTPDGEIIFLAANPDVKIKGIGTILLEELEKRERGKKLYLYTDDACTYQFYEHRGFERVGEKDVLLEFRKKTVGSGFIRESIVIEIQCLVMRPFDIRNLDIVSALYTT